MDYFQDLLALIVELLFPSLWVSSIHVMGDFEFDEKLSVFLDHFVEGLFVFGHDSIIKTGKQTSK